MQFLCADVQAFLDATETSKLRVKSIDESYMNKPNLSAIRGPGIHFRYSYVYQGEDPNGHLVNEAVWFAKTVDQMGYLGTVELEPFLEMFPRHCGYFLGRELNLI